MTETGLWLLSWWITAWLHALILLGAVWLAERNGWLRSPALRQASWRLALLAPLLTASLQLAADRMPWGARLALVAPAAQAPGAAAPGSATEHERQSGSGLPASTRRDSGVAPLASITIAADAGRMAARDRTTALTPLQAQARADRRLPSVWLAPALASTAWLWTLLVLALGGRLLRRWHSERRRCAGLADIAAADVHREAMELAQSARLAHVRLAADPELASPAAWAPATVCLPPWAISALRPRQRRAMLAHEIAHLARRDPYWQLLYALLPPLPLAALAQRRLGELAEHACDAWAARQSGGGRALAESLALCVERGFSGRMASQFAAPMAKGSSPLVERVQRLIEDRPMRFERVSALRRAALGAVVLAAALAMPGITLVGNPLLAGVVSNPAQLPVPPVPPQAPAPPAAPAPPPAPTAASLPAPPALPAAPVAPPAPPAPPAVPAAPAAPDHLSIESSDGLFGRAMQITIERGAEKLSFEADGKFAFNDAEDDLAALEDEATLIETRDGVTRRMDFAADGEQIERTYQVDGDEQPVDASARRWMASAILQLLRESGIDVEQRIARIRKLGGLPAVLAEIEQISSEHARGLYLTALFGLPGLGAGELDWALKQVAAMNSDYSRRTVLELLLARHTLSPERQISLLQIVASFDSDYDRRVLLVAAAPLLATDDKVQQAWFDALAACTSDYDTRVSLEAVLARDQLAQADLQRVIESASRMQSDYDRRATLEALAPRLGDSQPLAQAYANAVMAIGSDYDRRVALEAQIEGSTLTAYSGGIVLDVVDGLGSDFDRGEVMQALAAKMPADAALIARFRASARNLDDHTRGQVERALDRFQS